MQDINSNNIGSAANFIFLIKILEHAQHTIRCELLNHINDDDIHVINRLLEASQNIDMAIEKLSIKE